MLVWQMVLLWAALIIAIVSLVLVCTTKKRGRRGHRGGDRRGGAQRGPDAFFYQTPGTYTLTVPRRSSGRGIARLYGGGGGGAGSVGTTTGSFDASFGGGGGGGAYVEAEIRAEPGTELTIIVGAAGLGGPVVVEPSTGAGMGTNGGSSSVLNLLSPSTALIAGGGDAAPGLQFNGDISTSGAPGGDGGIPSPAPAAGVVAKLIGIDGQMGAAGDSFLGPGSGGGCANGGAGGIFAVGQGTLAVPGQQPGGGGSGGNVSPADTTLPGLDGGAGAVILYFY